ncbi:hypothetical protein [Bradyrhizobium sp. 76]|uniref:hypothetical protein n=1 Tax=Bradyrhizobium sp. 76 TaxID=2782680 RepID=UPI001FF89FDE|nr:hypothetical protein [Bradyrhizobium sp. 76]MCK1409533.1 hypothetical protein [Bradyrhizobium sp. 76]
MATQDDVQKVLDPYHQRIRGVVEKAWEERRAEAAWRAENGMDPLLYSRTVANYIFDAIARIAVNEFAGDASVHVKVEPQTIKLFFKGGVCARFKKGDDNKLGQNQPTQASLAFEIADAVLLWFPPETAKVEFIWLANELNTRLERVLVIARDGDRLLWEYDIDSVVGMLVALPIAPTPEPPSVASLITPKTTEIKKTEEKE